MQSKNKRRSVLLKNETVEVLKTLKSSYALARKKNITYDELINMLIEKGLETVDPKVNAIYRMVTENDENNNDTDELN